MTVSQLEASLTDDELIYWMALWQLEPWGEPAAWRRFGELMSMLANVLTASDTHPTDFIPT